MDNDKFVLLINAANETEASMLREILLDNGIDSYSQTRGMGSCYAVSGLLSVDIYISENQRRRAEAILYDLINAHQRTGRIYLPILAKKPIRRLKKLS